MKWHYKKRLVRKFEGGWVLWHLVYDAHRMQFFIRGRAKDGLARLYTLTPPLRLT